MNKRMLILFAAIQAGIVLIGYAWIKGLPFHLPEEKTAPNSFTVKGKQICSGQGDSWEQFEIRGVDMGTGIPGHWSSDFAADRETYLRWFQAIKEMGANTVRVYTINPESFYDALYTYNIGNDDPLYLLQGVWVDEYAQNSHIDAFDRSFAGAFLRDCKQAVDVIHGRKSIGTDAPRNVAKGTFRNDISPWVIGYIIGVEWEPAVVSYTNDRYAADPEKTQYRGEYLYTTEDASPFEAMLCYVGDGLLSYEMRKYGQQRLLAFSNWPSTDPFLYPEDIQRNLSKYCSVDTEHIRCTEQVLAGQFTSYHVYPYYPCYSNYLDDWSIYGISDKNDYLLKDGLHSYRAYLHGLVQHHTMPVVISEFGVPSSRGMASRDEKLGYNQGGMSEQAQGEALAACYEDIMEAGCAGSCIFTWQDEWFKRTWNTMHAVNLRRTCYWPDYQTNEQFFGLLSFDVAGEIPCCNDGVLTEWSAEDLLSAEDGCELYVKSDLKYLYFRIHRPGMDFQNDSFFIPIDVTPKSGSTVCAENGMQFDRHADFLIRIHGREDSRILVQERYDALRSTYAMDVDGFDTYLAAGIPEKASPLFTDIRLALQSPVGLLQREDGKMTAESYITGKLLYGSGNPAESSYISHSDFYQAGDDIEIRIPWQLLNFSDPTSGEIHDDYYEQYGVGYLKIGEIYAGITCDDAERTPVRLEEYRLPKFGNKPVTQERLKEAYYVMQRLWGAETVTENGGKG